MALFWFFAGCLGTLALVLALLPALRAVPALRSVPVALSPILSLTAIALALSLGVYVYRARPDLQVTPRASVAPATARAMGPGSPAAPSGGASTAGGSMDSAVANLEAKLAKGGGTPDEWELLAKSYEFLGRPQDAKLARAHQLPTRTDAVPSTPVVAPTLTPESQRLLSQAGSERSQRHYEKAVSIYARLALENQLSADGWADYADAAAALGGGKLTGAPEGYVDHALALDPKHSKALWLKASAAEEQGKWSEAEQYWQRLGAVLTPGSEDARIAAENLQHARKLAASSGAATARSASDASGSANTVSVTGDVTLAEGVRSRASPDATLFIVAKSVDSPGAPVAVLRQESAQWPVHFTLDDSLSMIPGRNLSGTSRVTIEARLSRSGQAMPASGDLKGVSSVIDPHVAGTIHVVIDQVVP